jgi:hypothetical protein
VIICQIVHNIGYLALASCLASHPGLLLPCTGSIVLIKCVSFALRLLTLLLPLRLSSRVVLYLSCTLSPLLLIASSLKRCNTCVFIQSLYPISAAPPASLLPTTIKTISPADLLLPRHIPDSPSPSKDLLDSPFFGTSSLPFPLTMDHRKSPEFSIETSPPNFTYDFSPDAAGSSNAAFEAFASSYTVYPASPPRMDFASLALNTPQSPPHGQPNFFSPHFINTNGSPNSLTSMSDRPLTPLEGATISPPLTYPQGASGSELEGIDEMPGTGNTSPTTGRAPNNSTRGSARYNPMPSRAARPAARKSATATRRNLRRDDDDMSDEEGELAESTLGMELTGSNAESVDFPCRVFYCFTYLLFLFIG